MSNRVLFRQEALLFQEQDRQWGTVATLQPLSTKLLSWSLVLSACAILTFLNLAQYARKETVVGYLTPSAGTAKIFAGQPGAVDRVYVHEGDVVQRGQPLITVTTDQISASGADVNTSLLETLTAQKAQLAKQIDAEQQRAISEEQRLKAQAQTSEAHIKQLREQVQLQGQMLKAAEHEYDTGKYLKGKGILTETELARRQTKVLEQRQALNTLDQQISSRQNDLTQTKFELEQLPTVMAQKLQSLRDQLSEAEQRGQEIEGRRAYVLRAPVSGRVTTLQANVGEHVTPERLQLEIIPDGGVLQANLFIPTRAIGFIKPGQPVRILYEAFPYQRFGAFKGSVEKISKTILTRADAAGPITLSEPSYRLIAKLDRTEIETGAGPAPLQPDMLLKADVILEKRSLMSWLLSPLLGIRM